MGMGMFMTGDPTAVTDASGHYSFGGLAPGMYTVMVEPQAGYAATGATEYMVDFSAGQFATTNYDFGELKLGTISGEVFNDSNANGVLDNGEQPASRMDRLPRQDNENGSYHTGDPTAVTGASGVFTFTNLTAGTYTVGEIAQTGYPETTTVPMVTVESGKPT